MAKRLKRPGHPNLVESAVKKVPGVPVVYPHLTKSQRWHMLETIVRQVEQGRGVVQAVRAQAVKYGKHEQGIWRLLRKYRSTTGIAGIYLKSQAMKMAQHVVKDGTVAEHIEVLSRPNLDVLKPAAHAEGGTGLFISVNATTCGAVSEVQSVFPSTPKGVIDVSHEATTLEGWTDEDADEAGPIEI